ncbi:PREDICTED: POM121 and ZP3 fusion protein-like, partial [Nestor notabilis]|uniref:POM121 and ZP3 fusion protein-like n=1 Tax=Nestor notabilis TaxID=176057 RepID=UPI000523D994
ESGLLKSTLINGLFPMDMYRDRKLLNTEARNKSSRDPCTKETVLSAIKEYRKRLLQQEDDQALGSDHENKRR